MTTKEVKRLRSGDEVYWCDPDEGTKSRVYWIRTIEFFDTLVVINEPSGSSLECFASELG